MMNTIIGIFVLLFGLNYMARNVDSLQSDPHVHTVQRFLEDPKRCAIVAVVVAFLLQSSTTAVLFVIGMVAGEWIRPKNAYLMVFAINVGTAIQVPILRVPVFTIIMAVGIFSLGAWVFNQRSRTRKLAGIGIGIALIFIGLQLIQGSLAQMAEGLWMQESFRRVVTPMQGLIQGIFWTSVLTSSGLSLLTFGAFIKTVTIPSLFYIMGANIGTATTALICTIADRSNTKRVAFMHLLINSVTTLTLTPIILLFGASVLPIVNQNFNMWPNPFHLFFNLILIAFGFLLYKPLVGFVERIIPQDQQGIPELGSFSSFTFDEHMNRLQQSIWNYYRIAIVQLEKPAESGMRRLLPIEKSIDDYFERLRSQQERELQEEERTDESTEKNLEKLVRVHALWKEIRSFSETITEKLPTQRSEDYLLHLLIDNSAKVQDLLHSTVQKKESADPWIPFENIAPLYHRSMVKALREKRITPLEARAYYEAWESLVWVYDALVQWQY